MSTQPCPKCGFLNRGGARYCGQCGIDLHGPAFAYIPLQTGQALKTGTYKVLRPLGKGGMGAVYLAAQTLAGTERHCVIKEMLNYVDPADFQDTQSYQEAVLKAQERFREEAGTLVALNHPGVPQIYDYFSEGGRNYIAMQWIEGESLDNRLSRKDEQGYWIQGSAQPEEEVVRWGVQLCRVLEYLAGRKPPVIHHDIKPANIILNKATGEVRLVDFGTAKARLTVQPGVQVGVRKSSIYGTAGYAAPEMYPPRSESEPRSDVYALGATLYHLLTDDDPRDHPFQFPNLTNLPSGIQKVFQQALENDVGRRITAGEMRESLEKLLEHPPTIQPFVFPSGQRAHNAEELALACEANWDDAKLVLRDGSLIGWLRTSLFRTDLANKAQATVDRQSDDDAALEEVLHVLDPNLTLPQLSVSPKRLNFGRVPPGKQVTKDLRIQNKASRGHLFGTVTEDPPVAWLSVSSTSFSGNNTSLSVTLNTAGQTQGVRLNTRLKIKNPFEAQEVPVQAHATFGWGLFLGSLVLFTILGGLLSGAGSYLIGQAALHGLNDELRGPLAVLGLLAALFVGLIMGSALGGPGGFSKRGFLLFSGLTIPIMGYLFLMMVVEFWILRTIGGDPLAYIGVAAVGIFISVLLGSFRGLRKARRMALSLLLPLLLIIAPTWWVANDPQTWLGTTTYRGSGNALPIP